MAFNFHVGWGRLSADALFSNRIHAGNIFLVLASTNSYWEKYTEMLQAVNPAGKVTVHATLQAAIDAAVDDGDDVIYVAAGHSEDVTAAGGLDVDKDGLTIIGLGHGSNRPTINFTTATSADMDIDEDNITFENFIFDLTGFDALVAPIDVNKTNCRFLNCEFITADSGGQCTLGILTDANASGLTIKNCYFKGSSNAGTAAAIRIVGGNDHVIVDNIFIGAYTTTLGAIDNVTTAIDRSYVMRNHIYNLTAAATKAMVFVATSTVILAGNFMQISSGSAPITAAVGSAVGANEFSAVKNSSIIIGSIYTRQ